MTMTYTLISTLLFGWTEYRNVIGQFFLNIKLYYVVDPGLKATAQIFPVLCCWRHQRCLYYMAASYYIKAMHVTMLGRQLHDVAHHVLGSSCTCITLVIWWTVIMSEPNNQIVTPCLITYNTEIYLPSGPPYQHEAFVLMGYTGPSGRYISVLCYQTWDQ